MFQTWWDLNKQIIRKAVDGLSAAAAGWLTAQGEWGAALVPVMLIAINFVWFWLDNRNKVTVAGLDKAGASSAAQDVARALATAKNRG